MTQKRTLDLSRSATFLAAIIALLLILPISYAKNQDNSTGIISSNLRGVYYGTADEQESALVGRVGIALVESAGIKQVPIDYTFQSGDKFRFLISSNHAGYLYIIHRSSENKLNQLWPSSKSNDAFKIRSGQSYTVPPNPGVFIFDKEVGKEQFYIAVRSEPKAPRLGVLEQANKADQTVTAPGVGEKPSTEEVEWIIRGDPFGEGSTRGVIFNPGKADGDLYQYFSAAPGDRSTKAMVQIMLNHSK